MILKRPFAFLIKHFRLIHAILSVLISYLVLKTSAMLAFISDYLILPTNLVDPKTTDTLFPIWIYFTLIILIIGYIVIMVLMKFKEKPITFYVVSIISMIFTIIAYVFAQSTTAGLEIALTDVRSLKLYQDFIRTAQIVQFFIAIVTIIRATGFNIKKFNFSRDLKELAIEDVDNEEFEVNLEVERGNLKRSFRKIKRHAKYVFVENKIMVSCLGILLLFGIGVFIYLNKFVYHKVYKQGEIVETNDFYFTFQNGYKTRYDYKQNVKKNTAYVIINFDVREKYGKNKKIETTRLYLEIHDHFFQHNKEKKSSFFDFGKIYNKEEIGRNKENYNLVYEIPITIIEDDMYLIYEETAGEKIRIKINPKFLDLPKKEISFDLKDTIDFKDSIIQRSTLEIKDFVINDYYKNTYQFCVAKNNCYESAEYIMPTFQGNDDKAIMKIEADWKLDDTLYISEIDSFPEFLNSFVKLHYKIDGVEKIEEGFKEIKAKSTYYKNIYYIEVKKEIKKADEIWFEITVRDKKYKYQLQ